MWAVLSETNRGKVRSRNQDALVMHKFNFSEGEVYLCGVADGMGGHLAGDVASSIAVDELLLGVQEYLDILPVYEVLPAAVARANRMVLQESLVDPNRSGMGTTLTAALVFADKAYICHVGDSRAYSYGQGRLMRLTEDHSYVEELLRRGELTLGDAERHPQRNVLTRALGVHEELQKDCQLVSLHAVERLLFCTDGLTKLVRESEIESIMRNSSKSAQVMQCLLALALDRGAPDNVTALIVAREGGSSDGH